MNDTKIAIEDLDEISSIPIDKLTSLQHLTFGWNFNQLPIKFLQNFMELQKINLCLFSWETIIK